MNQRLDLQLRLDNLVITGACLTFNTNCRRITQTQELNSGTVQYTTCSHRSFFTSCKYKLLITNKQATGHETGIDSAVRDAGWWTVHRQVSVQTDRQTVVAVVLVMAQSHRLWADPVCRHHLDVKTVAGVDVTLGGWHKHVFDQRHHSVDRQRRRRTSHVGLVLHPNLTTITATSTYHHRPVRELILNCTSAQLGYTVPFTLVHAGKYRTEDKNTDIKTKHTPEKANNAKHSKTKLPWLIGLSSVLRPLQHSIGYMVDGFYRSKDPTNSIKELKEKAAKENNTNKTKKTENTNTHTK